MSKVYTRTDETEAKRRLAQAKTWYAKMVEKNRKAEAEYEAKIAGLEATVNELTGEAEHQHQLKLAAIQHNIGLSNGQYRDELGFLRDKTGMWQE